MTYFNNDVPKYDQKIWNEYNVVNTLLVQPEGTLLDSKGKTKPVQEWTQATKTANENAYNRVDNVGKSMACALVLAAIIGTVVSCIFPFIFGYVALGCLAILISACIPICIGSSYESTFQEQTLLRIQKLWKASNFEPMVEKLYPYASENNKKLYLEFLNIGRNQCMGRNTQATREMLAEVFAKTMIGYNKILDPKIIAFRQMAEKFAKQSTPNANRDDADIDDDLDPGAADRRRPAGIRSHQRGLSTDTPPTTPLNQSGAKPAVNNSSAAAATVAVVAQRQEGEPDLAPA